MLPRWGFRDWKWRREICPAGLRRSAPNCAWAPDACVREARLQGGVIGTTTALRHALLALGISLTGATAGCDGPPATPSRDAASLLADCSAWQCPEGWVASSAGGCGPALLLCSDDGGATPGSCADVGVEGVAVAGGWRLEPGGVRGPWPEDDDLTSGVPQTDWSPATVPTASFAPDTALTCADGWQRLASGLCDPRLNACAAGALPLPGGRCTPTATTGCRDDGSAAGLGVPAGAAVRWVQAGAPVALPDGTLERPFATVEQALRDAPSDAWLLLRNGSHAAGVAVTRGVHMVGACGERVTLTAPADSAAALTVHDGAALDLRGVSVRGPSIGVIVEGAGSLTATGVTFDALPSHAVLAPAASSTVRADGCVFTAVATRPPSAADAAAVLAGGRLSATRCHFARTGAPAIRVGGAAAVATVLDCAFVDTADIALVASSGAAVTLSRAAFVRAAYAAWSVDGARMEAADVAVSDATPGPSGITRGAYVSGAASVRVRGLSVRNATMTGFVADGPCDVRIERAAFVGARLVRCHPSAQGRLECSAQTSDWEGDTRSGLFGESVYAKNGATMALRNVAFADGEGMALHVENATVDAQAIRVERYANQRMGTRGVLAGAAVAAYSDERTGTASLTLRSALIANNTHFGLLAFGPGTAVVLRGGVIRDGHTPSWEGALPPIGGASAARGASLRILDSRLSRNEQYNAVALDDATLLVEDSLLEEGRGAPGVGNGSGVGAEGAHVTASRCVFSGNQRAGATAALGGWLRLERCVVRGTLPHPEDLAATLPEDRVATAGAGVYAWLDGHIDVVDSRVTTNRGLGVGAFGRAAWVNLLHSVVVDQEGATDLAARGVESSAGGEVRVDATLLLNNEQISLNASGPGSRLVVVDSMVRSTRTHEGTASGFGLQVTGGAQATLSRAWLEDSTRLGLVVTGVGSQALLRDVTIVGVRSTVVSTRDPNQGFGVFVGDGGALHAERLGIVDVGGAALASSSESAPAWIDVRDLFARGVRRAQIRTVAPIGAPVAYGVHTAGRATLLARRATVDGADYGFVRVGGTLDLNAAVFASARRAAGSSTGRAPGEELRATGVCAPNAAHAAVVSDETLPAALVETQLSGCAVPPCDASVSDR